MPQSSRARASRFLYQWEDVDGLDANGSLIPRSGQDFFFTRSGAATAVDARGAVYPAGYASPRFHHQYDAASGLYKPVGVLLENARTNLVIQSDAMTAANGWSLGANATTSAAFSLAGVLPLTRVALTGSAGSNDVDRAVGVANGANAVSQVVQFDGVAGFHICCGLVDTTASVIRCRAQVTWASDGTATCVAIDGTLLAFIPLGAGTYRLLMQSTACTGANTHLFYASLSTAGPFSFRAGGCQVEDAPFPSSIISTTTTAVTRQQDATSSIFSAQPQPMTIYLRFMNLGSTLTNGQPVLFSLGSLGTPAALQIWCDAASSLKFSYFNNSGTQAVTLACAAQLGDLVEVRGVLAADGSFTLGISINGGTEVTGTSLGGPGIPATWSQLSLALSDAGSVDNAAAWQSVRIAGGAPSLPQMRAA